MQRATEGDVHFLEAAADAEDRHAALDAGIDQRQGHRVALLVVGFVGGMRLGPEARRMDVGAGAGEQDPVDRAQQRLDVGDVRGAGEHQRQRPGDVRDRPHVALTHELDVVAVVDHTRIADHPDHGLLLAGNQATPASTAKAR